MMRNFWIHILLSLELYQLLFWLFKSLIRWRNLVLELSLKVIFRIWMFRVYDKHFIFYGYWWKLSQLIMVFLLELYQLLFLFFKPLIRWRNLVLEISLKVIFRIWMFRVNYKRFILNGSWWKLSQFIIVFFLEIYQLFFLFSKLWSYEEILACNFLSKWSSQDECSELMASTSFWMGLDKNFFNSSWCSSLNYINSSPCFSKIWSGG